MRFDLLNVPDKGRFIIKLLIRDFVKNKLRNIASRILTRI